MVHRLLPIGGEVAQPPRATRTAMPRTIIILFSKADVYTLDPQLRIRGICRPVFFSKKKPPLFLVVQFIVLRMVPMLHVPLGAFASSTYGVPRRVTAINLLPCMIY